MLRQQTSRLLAFSIVLLATSLASAQEYAEQWGPAVGSAIPVLNAPDQTGQIRDLQSLSGEQGLLLFLNRSADW